MDESAARSARLDALAEDTAGDLYILEIQRRDKVDHPRRVRFYRSMTDSECLDKGMAYSQLPKLHIFYISETDIWHLGKTICPVRNYLGNEGGDYDDGSFITYVNAKINDGSQVAALMQYFRTADPDDNSQGALSRRVRYLKCEEGGLDLMCEISERIEQRGREAGRREGILEGRREGILEARHESALSMAELGIPVEQIAKVVKENVSLVREWIAEGPAQAK